MSPDRSLMPRGWRVHRWWVMSGVLILDAVRFDGLAIRLRLETDPMHLQRDQTRWLSEVIELELWVRASETDANRKARRRRRVPREA